MLYICLLSQLLKCRQVTVIGNDRDRKELVLVNNGSMFGSSRPRSDNTVSRFIRNATGSKLVFELVHAHGTSARNIWRYEFPMSDERSSQNMLVIHLASTISIYSHSLVNHVVELCQLG